NRGAARGESAYGRGDEEFGSGSSSYGRPAGGEPSRPAPAPRGPAETNFEDDDIPFCVFPRIQHVGIESPGMLMRRSGDWVVLSVRRWSVERAGRILNPIARAVPRIRITSGTATRRLRSAGTAALSPRAP